MIEYVDVEEVNGVASGITVYECEGCGDEFYHEEECREHESRCSGTA